MQAEDVIKLATQGEDSRTQFKRNVTSAVQMAQEMVAFSNANGGSILIGVNDDGSIAGLSADDVGRINQLVANSATENVKPALAPTTEIVLIDGKRVLVVEVRPGENKPYCTSEGVYWTKVGSDKRKMSQEELLRIFQSAGKIYADETVIPQSSSGDIRQDQFGAFFRKKFRKNIEKAGVPLETILKNMNLGDGNSLTLAGLMLFGKNPQQFRPAFSTACVSFLGNGIGGTEFRDKETVEGAISEQYEGAMRFLMRNLRKVQTEKSFNSQGSLEIPQVVLEEIVINALIHRDYFIDSPVKVLMFDDRIEVVSPGKLPNSLTVENIKNGISVARNPVIHSIGQYVLPYSGLGSGIVRALQKYKDIGFSNDAQGDRFAATIRRPT